MSTRHVDEDVEAEELLRELYGAAEEVDQWCGSKTGLAWSGTEDSALDAGEFAKDGGGESINGSQSSQSKGYTRSRAQKSLSSGSSAPPSVAGSFSRGSSAHKPARELKSIFLLGMAVIGIIVISSQFLGTSSDRLVQSGKSGAIVEAGLAKIANGLQEEDDAAQLPVANSTETPVYSKAMIDAMAKEALAKALKAAATTPEPVNATEAPEVDEAQRARLEWEQMSMQADALSSTYEGAWNTHGRKDASLASTEPEAELQDLNWHCEMWARKGECQSRTAGVQAWMFKNCAKSCFTPSVVRSSGVPSAPSPAGVVVDREKCDKMASEGACKSQKHWMQVHCIKSCRALHDRLHQRDKTSMSGANSGLVREVDKGQVLSQAALKASKAKTAREQSASHSPFKFTFKRGASPDSARVR